MARPVKKGLDYFPVDTTWDIKMKLVKARFGLVGTGCIIELFKTIYSEGYALKWDDDTRLLFSAENGIDAETLKSIISFAVLKGVFHAGKLDKLGVLTSSGIQKRWLKVAKDSNRAIQEIDPSISLIDINGLSVQETELSAQEMQPYAVLSGTEIPHIRVEDIKGDKNKKTCTSYSPDIPQDSPEEAHATISEPEPEPEDEQQEPGAYPKAVYAAWEELGPHVYQPASLWAFSQKWGQQVRPHLKGIHSKDVLQALENLKAIYEAPTGTYYWTQKIGVEAFFSKHLEKFLPANVNPDDFKKRLSFIEQQEAETRASYLQVFGHEMGEEA